MQQDIVEQRRQFPHVPGGRGAGYEDLELEPQVCLAQVVQHSQYGQALDLLFRQRGAGGSVQGESNSVEPAKAAEHEADIQAVGGEWQTLAGGRGELAPEDALSRLRWEGEWFRSCVIHRAVLLRVGAKT